MTPVAAVGPSDDERGTGPQLQLRHVRRTFTTAQGEVEVLAGIDLVAHRGEFVSVIGPSGCGKSTLLQIVAGLVEPDGGEVFFGDGPSHLPEGNRSAYMPQRDLLFPWRKVIDNVTLGLEVGGLRKAQARRVVAPLLEAFGLSGFESAYPFQLSGGMRQRAALLRTVVQQRDLLLLDEPLGALDSLTRSEMQIWLGQVWESYRWTVLLVTHDIREALYLSDTVYVLSARPSRVAGRFEVALPRPRSQGVLMSEAATDLERRVLRSLQKGTAA